MELESLKSSLLTQSWYEKIDDRVHYWSDSFQRSSDLRPPINLCGQLSLRSIILTGYWLQTGCPRFSKFGAFHSY